MCWITFPNAGLSLKAIPGPTIMPNVLTTRPWPTRKNGLELAIWYHTPGTTASRFQTVTFKGACYVHFHYLYYESCSFERVMSDVARHTDDYIETKYNANDY